MLSFLTVFLDFFVSCIVKTNSFLVGKISPEMCPPDRLTDIDNKIKLIDAVLQIFLFCANGTDFLYIILFKRKKGNRTEAGHTGDIYKKTPNYISAAYQIVRM
jgi:hypothetical protein